MAILAHRESGQPNCCGGRRNPHRRRRTGPADRIRCARASLRSRGRTLPPYGTARSTIRDPASSGRARRPGPCTRGIADCVRSFARGTPSRTGEIRFFRAGDLPHGGSQHPAERHPARGPAGALSWRVSAAFVFCGSGARSWPVATMPRGSARTGAERRGDELFRRAERNGGRHVSRDFPGECEGHSASGPATASRLHIGRKSE